MDLRWKIRVSSQNSLIFTLIAKIFFVINNHSFFRTSLFLKPKSNYHKKELIKVKENYFLVENSYILEPLLRFIRLINVWIRNSITGSHFSHLVNKYLKLLFLFALSGIFLFSLAEIISISLTIKLLLYTLLLAGLITVIRIPVLGILLFSLYIPIKWGLKQIMPNMEPGYTLFGPVLLVIIFLGYFNSQDFSKGIKISLTKIDKSLLILLGATLLSNISSFLIYNEPVNLLVESFVWLQSITLLYLVRVNVNTTLWLKRLLIFSYTLVTLVALGGIYQWAIGYQTPADWIESYDAIIETRVISSVGNPNGLAGYLNIFIILGMSLILFMKNLRFRLLMGTILGILLFTLLLTYSRGAWLALVGSMIFITSLYDRRFLLLLIIMLILSPLFLPETVILRLANIVSPEHLASSAQGGRLWSIQNVLHILPNHLWLGVGLGMYGGTVAVTRWSPVYAESMTNEVAIPYVDNQFFQILIQQGVIGLFLFIVFGLTVFWLGLKIYKSLSTPKYKGLALGIVGGWFSYLFQGLVASVMEFPQISIPAWLLLGLLFNLKNLEEMELQEEIYD